MKAVLLESPRKIGMKDVPEPERKNGEALVRVRSASICGSDIGAYKGLNPLVRYPRILGHEIAGEIVETSGDDSKLKRGDHVIVDPYRYCGACYPCSIGRTNCCEDLKVIGVHIDGGMQEYISYPENMLILVPKNMPWELVPLAEPLTIALHAIHRTKLQPGEHIAINGAGAIGMLIALSAISYGAHPILIDMVDARLAFAKQLGIRHTINIAKQDLLKTIGEITNGRMAEVVVEASGSNEAIRNTLNMVSYAGRIALTGWPKSETPVSTDIITRKEVDVLGSRVSVGEFNEAIDLIDSNKVDVAAIISKIVALEEIPQMLAEQAEFPDRYLKIVACVSDSRRTE